MISAGGWWGEWKACTFRRGWLLLNCQNRVI